MTSFSTILDNFNSNTINTSLWTLSGYVSPTFANQQLQMTMAASTTATVGMQSISTYDLTNSACSIQVVDAGPQTFNGWQVIPIFILKDFSNELYFQIENGFIQAFTDVGGIATSLQTATYSSTNHQFLRIRESSGTVYWDTSADGKTWTNFTSVADPFVITSLYMSFLAQTASSNTVPMTAKLDNFNVIQIVSSDSVSQLDSGTATILSNQAFTVTDSGIGSEVSGALRSIVVSRNPTNVGIAGLVNIVHPDFPEFTFGTASSGLLSVAVSDVDSIHSTDSIANFAFGDTDNFVLTDVGTHTTSVVDMDSSVGSDVVSSRSITVLDSSTTTDASSGLAVFGFVGVDSVIGSDLGTQSYAVTSMDSSNGSENQNVNIGPTLPGTDNTLLSENQTISIFVSDVDSSVLAEAVGSRSLSDADASTMSETINRSINIIESSLGSDFGFVAITSTDSCATTDQQSMTTALTSVDSSQETESVSYPIALSTTIEWMVGLDTIASRSIQSFDSSQTTTDVVGNRTLQDSESITGSDAGIHGNFVFSPDSIRMSEAFIYPVYSPASTESIVGADASAQANGISDTDSVTLTDSQTFTLIGFQKYIMSDSAQVTSVAITATESIQGVDAVAYRVVGDIDQIVLTDTAATSVAIVATESIQETDAPVLYVPITQNDRSPGTDNSGSVFAHVSDANPVIGVDNQSVLYKPSSSDSINISENISLVENPPNFNATITVTDSVIGSDSGMSSFIVISIQNSNMSETQDSFRSNSTTDSGQFQAESQSTRAAVSASDSIVMGESTSIVAASTTAESIRGTDNQVDGPVTSDRVTMTETASVVKYISLNMSVWSYGQVSVLK